MYRLCLKIDWPGIRGELQLPWAPMEESSEARIMQIITALHAFPFLHSCHYQVWVHCWKTSLFLPVTEMLSQDIKREEDYEELFARSLLVPRRNHWILGRGSASVGAYRITIGAVTAADTGNMFNFLLRGWKHCGIISGRWRKKQYSSSYKTIWLPKSLRTQGHLLSLCSLTCLSRRS